MEKTRTGGYLALTLAAALLLLAFSASSPLYPTNPSLDANCYMTIGRAMHAGLVPYRDLVDHKGPLLYALHWLAALVPGPGGFLGVYLLEVAALALFLIAAWRTVLLFDERGRGALPLLIAVAAVALRSESFTFFADSAEELCLPLLAWSLYDAMKYLRGGGEMRPACLLRNGVLAGCVLWIKYSLLGLHFAWMAFVAIDCLARGGGLGRAVRMCLIFLAGMALSGLPWLIWLGANGALDDFFQIYFVTNLTTYHANASIPWRVARGMYDALRFNPCILLLTAAGLAGALASRRAGWREKLCLLAMAVGVAVFTNMTGKRYAYLFHVWLVFAPLALPPLTRLLGRLPGRAAARATAAGAAALVCVAALVTSPLTARIGFPREELVQEQFAREIRRTENPTLLNCGFIDGGFYLAADVLPTERFFCAVNLLQDECLAAQRAAVEGGAPDYVVTRGYGLDEMGISDGAYESVMTGEGTFGPWESGFTYRLYRRRGLG